MATRREDNPLPDQTRVTGRTKGGDLIVHVDKAAEDRFIRLLHRKM